MITYNEMKKIKTPCVDYTGSKEGRFDNGYEATINDTNYKIIYRRQWSALKTGRNIGFPYYQLLVNNERHSWNFNGSTGNTFSKDSALNELNKLVGEA